MNALTLPLTNRLLVLTAPHAANDVMIELAARLSLAGELRVLDGGNRFNVYPLARIIRRYTSELTGALARISLMRAFTCYQAATMLAEMAADNHPLLVLDLLSTFYDENVSLEESRRLLTGCIPHLQRLSRLAPVVVSAKPPAFLCAERAVLVEALQAAAGGAWQLEALPAPQAPTLWEGGS
jgi:hypothetical protein